MNICSTLDFTIPAEKCENNVLSAFITPSERFYSTRIAKYILFQDQRK